MSRDIFLSTFLLPRRDLQHRRDFERSRPSEMIACKNDFICLPSIVKFLPACEEVCAIVKASEAKRRMMMMAFNDTLCCKTLFYCRTTATASGRGRCVDEKLKINPNDNHSRFIYSRGGWLGGASLISWR
jgi:hypothetical protein